VKANQVRVSDLYKERDKAEIVEGKIVRLPLEGFLPSYASGSILVALTTYSIQLKRGYALGSKVAYIVNLPNRKSFSPDASFFIGKTTGMKFIEGAPAFAVEVRSENDYGPKAEKAMADKRADYFVAGTQIVWDVDMLSTDVIRAYSIDTPDTPKIFRRGDTANAEPAVPGWTLAVDDLFPYYSK
jgi:Uma2 family endonuclease